MQKQKLADFIDYDSNKFTKRIIFKEGPSTAFMLNFSGEQSLPAHKHPGSHVFLQVINGEGTFNIDGEEHLVGAGDYVFVTGEEELAFQNNAEEQTSIHVLLNRTPDERFATNI